MEARPVTVQLTENSTPDEVSTWLQEKGFSIRVIELLEGQDGANLFALNKTSLMQACGREEGSRLYSQLLVQKKQSNRAKVDTKPRITVARRNPETEAVVTELQETVGKSGGQVLRKMEARPVTVQLTENSTPDEVSTWLQEKGFSIRVIELLEGQDGANLFALNKTSLMQACGREEGSRLYSQLLVQKKQSNKKLLSIVDQVPLFHFIVSKIIEKRVERR
ncbi:hypothetical protein Y032_0013g2188 [Ancylostoma ceylanicum]|nr:hypothetical protein Y032_0013g2188 [Ancylostoma ceylanicum]